MVMFGSSLPLSINKKERKKNIVKVGFPLKKNNNLDPRMHSTFLTGLVDPNLVHTYLRNHLTHTVNNLLQTLNNVKAFKVLLLNKTSILFASCVEISKQYLGYYA